MQRKALTYTIWEELAIVSLIKGGMHTTGGMIVPRLPKKIDLTLCYFHDVLFDVMHKKRRLIMSLEYYVNVDSGYPPKVHTSVCIHAQDRPQKTHNGGWHGPYNSYQQAWDYAKKRVRTRDPQNCADCQPNLQK